MASSSSKTLPLFLLLTCSLLCSSWPTASGIRFPDHDEVLQKFKQWMTRYGREYKDEAEKLYRLGVFTDNLKYVDAFVKSGERSYSVGLNQFADLTNEEFLAGHTGLRQSNASKPTASHFSYDNVTTVPATVDWRSRGVVTSIKDQGSCGSCWAFSSVAAMESIILIKKRKQLDLSEQELVDCDFFNSGRVTKSILQSNSRIKNQKLSLKLQLSSSAQSTQHGCLVLNTLELSTPTHPPQVGKVRMSSLFPTWR